MSSKRKPRKVVKSEASSKDGLWENIRADAGRITVSLAKAYCRIGFSLVFTDVIQSSLDPVYGHIPASRYHNSVVLAALLISCSTYGLWGTPSRRWTQTMMVMVLLGSSNQTYLFRFSGQLGPQLGPLLTSLITVFPIILISAIPASSGFALESWKTIPATGEHRNGVFHANLLAVVNAGVSLMAYMTNHFASNFLGQWLRVYILRSRVALYHLLSFFYTLFFASGKFAFVAIPILQSVLISSYIPFPYTNSMLNTTLHKHGFSLVARQDSNTGYISVLDNERDGFRVMRCDHSLLGGEWIPPRGHASKLHEPIYAIFVMLEAVRLVQPQSARAQLVQKSALVV